MTEGCVRQTALSGLKRGYDVHVVVDAVAGETRETHYAAVQRLVQAGVVPVTWLAVTSEFQVTYQNLATVQGSWGSWGNIRPPSARISSTTAPSSPPAPHVASRRPGTTLAGGRRPRVSVPGRGTAGRPRRV